MPAADYIILCSSSEDYARFDTNLLKKHSGYFAAALRHRSLSREYLDIPGVPSWMSTFIAFEGWLKVGIITSQTLELALKHKRPSTNTKIVTKTDLLDTEISTTVIDLLIECWILGDFLIAPGFQNYIMSQLMFEYRKFTAAHGMPVHNLEYIREFATSNSGLHLFMVDALFAHLGPKTIALLYRDDSSDLMEDLLLDLAVAGLEYKISESPAMGRAPWAHGVDEKVYYVKPADRVEEPETMNS